MTPDETRAHFLRHVKLPDEDASGSTDPIRDARDRMVGQLRASGHDHATAERIATGAAQRHTRKQE